MIDPSPLRARRRFIKTLTFTTAFSTLLGQRCTDLFAAEVAPQSTQTFGTLRIKISDFPALGSESGSVRLAINPLNDEPRPIGSFYPVILNRGPSSTFFALSSNCTHQGCVIGALDASSNEMTCPCHGSVYAIDGRRLRGQASSALRKYTVRFDGRQLLEVDIPSLGFTVTGSAVQPGGADRYRLDFRAQRNVTYEVYLSDSPSKAPALVPFSSTAEGPLEETNYTSAATANRSFYVARSDAPAFYSIAVRLTEI
jgi:nitrite reductase/ring-hydroxylating ferredoxin subunit